jgi:hypothetical protein
MNSISVSLDLVDAGDGTRYESIQIRIDGSCLQDIVRDYEMPFALREGHPDIAGGYLGLDSSVCDHRAFFGEVDRDYGDESDKTLLMECACGCPGCWPLVARITVTDTSVIWSDFEQPHRGPDSAGGHWDYSSFGPFEFELEEYSREFAKIKTKAQQVGSSNGGQRPN